ncbi:MAG TPA: hypothetical protein VGO62_22515, partial [Myxococcota bacterium]
MTRGLLVALALLFVSACGTAAGTVRTSVDESADKRRPARNVDPTSINVDAVRFAGEEPYAWFDGNTGRSLSFDEVSAKMNASKVVMVGEQHDQAAHHEL